MSWLSGLAKNIEAGLNKLDSAANQAIQGETTITNLHADINQGFHKNYQNIKPSPLIQSNFTNLTPVNGASNLNKVAKNQNSVKASSFEPNSSNLTQSTKKEFDSDSALFEFLNSSNSNKDLRNGKQSPDKLLKSSVSHENHSRKSSSSSLASLRSNKVFDTSQTMDHSTPRSVTPAVDETSSALQSFPDNYEINQTGDSSSGYHSQPEDSTVTSQQFSSLELENKLLKNEIVSLNQEMTSIINRVKITEQGHTSYQDTIEKMRMQLNERENIVRECQARENDFQEALAAKDAQISVLRVRYEEADKEIVHKIKTIEEISTEKDRILQDHTSSSGLQSQAVDNLKDKLSEVEAELRKQIESYRNLQEDSEQRHAALQLEQHKLSESLISTQKKYNDEKGKLNELNSQLKSAKLSAEVSKQELIDYKDKATRILQTKERLISSLKEGTNGDSDTNTIQSVELEEMRQDKEILREELQHARMIIENLRSDIQDLEMQHQTDIDSLQEELRTVDELCNTEKQRAETAENENNKQKHELRFTHEEILKQKTEYQTRLADRDNEIEKLRNQLTVKSSSSINQEELENRLHALTESLIHKQTMIEALSTEKNSLGHQLERLESQYRDIQKSVPNIPSTSVKMNDEDEVQQRLPIFMKASPLDGDVSRRFKRAANTIDRFSIRLGIFLRRYPVARVFVICYMGLLHLWVMIVLLTYQPEIHGNHHILPSE